MPEYVAFLRGINVGGRHKLPMRQLASIFSEAGCTHVATYLQSGNVMFDAAREIAEGIQATITRTIDQELGFRVPMIVRSVEQMANVVAMNPWIAEGVTENMLHVYFLQARPEPGQVLALDPARSPGDAFLVREQEVYLKLPDGMARTKLTNAYFDARLKTISTGRNWRTVTAIRDALNG